MCYNYLHLIMQQILPEELKKLAAACAFPLYAVGGAVRDYLAGLTPDRRDWDICAPVRADVMAAAAKDAGWELTAEYGATGSLKLRCGGTECEFTSFRTDEYAGMSGHAPLHVEFTADICADARRRDFTCNAVYYDICAGQFIDPLGGAADIAARRLVPCAPAQILFSADALRILRMCRFCGELGFLPSPQTEEGAAACAAGLKSISPTLIWREVCGMLRSYRKYSIPGAPGRALRLAARCGALNVLFPALSASGEEGVERAICAVERCECILVEGAEDYPFGSGGARTACSRAFLADDGLAAKLACLVYGAGEEGVAGLRVFSPSARALGACLRAVSAVRSFPAEGCAGERVKHLASPEGVSGDALLLARCADGRVFDGMADTIAYMRSRGVPFSARDLALRGDGLIAVGVPPRRVGEALRYLFERCVARPELNNAPALAALARKFIVK